MSSLVDRDTAERTIHTEERHMIAEEPLSSNELFRLKRPPKPCLRSHQDCDSLAFGVKMCVSCRATKSNLCRLPMESTDCRLGGVLRDSRKRRIQPFTFNVASAVLYPMPAAQAPRVLREQPAGTGQSKPQKATSPST